MALRLRNIILAFKPDLACTLTSLKDSLDEILLPDTGQRLFVSWAYWLISLGVVLDFLVCFFVLYRSTLDTINYCLSIENVKILWLVTIWVIIIQHVAKQLAGIAMEIWHVSSHNFLQCLLFNQKTLICHKGVLTLNLRLIQIIVGFYFFLALWLDFLNINHCSVPYAPDFLGLADNLKALLSKFDGFNQLLIFDLVDFVDDILVELTQSHFQ